MILFNKKTGHIVMALFWTELDGTGTLDKLRSLDQRKCLV